MQQQEQGFFFELPKNGGGKADAADTWRRQEGDPAPTPSLNSFGWEAQQQQRQQQQQRAYGSQPGSWHGGSGGSGRERSATPEQQQQQRQKRGTGWRSSTRQDSPRQGRGLPGGSSSNILPFPGKSNDSEHVGGQDGGGGGGWRGGRASRPSANATAHSLAMEAQKNGGFFFDNDESDTRPILLFDMNGTLTSHTSMRRSAGRNRPRPGTHHLRRLAERFRIGVFTSATLRTVSVAVDMLEQAAGQGPPLFDRSCMLYRDHTLPVPDVGRHVAAGGKPWDTIKPLGLFFRRLHRVVVVDDDAYKAAPGEEGNMLLVPRWEDDDPGDGMLGPIVDALLALADKVGDNPEADLRPLTKAASEALAATAARLAAERGRDAGAGGSGT